MKLMFIVVLASITAACYSTSLQAAEEGSSGQSVAVEPLNSEEITQSPRSESDSALEPIHAPLTEEDVVIKAIESEAQKKVKELSEQMKEAKSELRRREINAEIEKTKSKMEKSILEAYLDFAIRDRAEERIEEIISALEHLESLERRKESGIRAKRPPAAPPAGRVLPSEEAQQ